MTRTRAARLAVGLSFAALGGCAASSRRLFKAVDAGQPRKVEALLARGAAIDALNAAGRAPLHEAILIDTALRRKPEVSRVLIEKGANVNLKDRDGSTPLILALAGGSAEIARLLIEKGADVNKRDADGRAPLAEAVKNKNSEIARLLLEKGVDAAIRDKDGMTLLSSALFYGDFASARLLVEKGALLGLNSPDILGTTPLNKALISGRAELARLLIEKGADVNKRDANAVSPLMAAGSQGEDEFVELLVRKGADATGAGAYLDDREARLAADAAAAVKAGR